MQFDAKQVEETLRVETLEVEKKELEKKVISFVLKHSQQNKVKEQQKRIDELEQENTSNKSQIKQLSEKSNLKTQKLEAKVESLNEKIKSLQSQLAILQKEKENIQNSAQQLQQIVANSKASSSSIGPVLLNPVLDGIKSGEQFVIDLYENQPPPSVERKTSTTSSHASKDQRFDETLLKQPGAERAKLWTYTPNGNIDGNSYKWDDGNWSAQCIVIKMEKRPFAEGSLRTAYYTRNLGSPDLVYVAKFSKNRSHGREIYENDVEMQIFCQNWSQKFK